MRLFSRKPVRSQPARRILRLPKSPVAIYAIGDIHGCADLYRAAEDRIIADGLAFPGEKLIVCLGDVVDRGPDSHAVLDHLAGPSPEGFTRVTLCGNHEAMLLGFLAEPERNADWLLFGGVETLRSYGVVPPSATLSKRALTALANDFRSVLPAAHRVFLESLPLGLLIDRVCFAHAFYDFSKPPERQSEESILWGGPDFPDHDKTGSLLVHGHFIVPEPHVAAGRINIDTGAYLTGRLTVLRLTGPELVHQFI